MVIKKRRKWFAEDAWFYVATDKLSQKQYLATQLSLAEQQVFLSPIFKGSKKILMAGCL